MHQREHVSNLHLPASHEPLAQSITLHQDCFGQPEPLSLPNPHYPFPNKISKYLYHWKATSAPSLSVNAFDELLQLMQRYATEGGQLHDLPGSWKELRENANI